MQADRRKVLLQMGAGAVAAGAWAMGAREALADNFPSKPVRIVLPYPAGGATDVLTRAIADALSKSWTQPVIVDHKPGASGMIGADAVAKAAPDGYTALVTITSFVQAVSLYSKPPYDVLKDFAPATELGSSPVVYCVNASSPARNLAEFIALAKSKPGELSFASYGTGSGSHLYHTILQDTTGMNLIHVPYKGEAPILNDLLGGQVTVAFNSVMAVKPHIASGKLRALALTGTARSPQLPNVPTFAEAGVPNMDMAGWFGLLLPGKTPRPLVEKFSADVRRALADPALRGRMAEMGITLSGSSPDDFALVVRNDYARWGKVIRTHNIRLD